MRQETVQCCVVGGGPAGIMLGVLLARQGVKVIVLKKHADFLRDFRGDSIHPSTQELIFELSWIDEFLQIPHTRMDRATLEIDEKDRFRYPGPIGVVTFCTTGACRFPAASPRPQQSIPSTGLEVTGHHRGFTHVRPAGLPLRL
ncbi:MAG: FAD-dependent monooxygenase [Pseudonocardiaceae bacterium]